MSFQNAKKLVLRYFDEMENASPDSIESVLEKYTSGQEYIWKGVYPFREQIGVKSVAESFWKPLTTSIKHLQRRQDIFIAGNNELASGEWVMSMGHFMGLFDEDFLGIRKTNKVVSIRYAEFNCVVGDKIVHTGLFLDLIGLMLQAGVNPLPPSTGQYFVYPGPRNHNGLLFNDADPKEGEKTLALLNKMLDDLNALNLSGSMGCPPEILEKTWSKNMAWYGPAGIGATYTIPRYQQQHQLPFRGGLKDKEYNGQVCRFAEGDFACLFGWRNLSNTPIGGFLGLPGGLRADMQVVDVYCKIDDKLSENWVFIDIPYWLKQQGLDIFERTQEILNQQ